MKKNNKKRLNLEVKLIFALCVLIISCNQAKEKKNDATQVTIERNDTLHIEMNNNQYDAVNGNSFNILSNKKGDSKVYLDKKSGLVSGISNELTNGLYKEFQFHKNVLLSEVRYYKDTNGGKSTSEIICYKNSAIDFENSAFIDIKKINESELDIEFEISYEGAYTFKYGTIYIGKKSFSHEDSKNMLSFKMINRKQKILISKDEMNRDVLYFNIHIERGVDKEIESRKTFPSKGKNSFGEWYIKEYDLNQ